MIPNHNPRLHAIYDWTSTKTGTRNRVFRNVIGFSDTGAPLVIGPSGNPQSIHETGPGRFVGMAGLTARIEPWDTQTEHDIACRETCSA